MNNITYEIGNVVVLNVGTHVIETERLILRRFTKDDATDMFNNWINDKEVQANYGEPVYESIEAVKELLDKWIVQYKNSDFYRWAIVLKENNQCIGQIAFCSINLNCSYADIEYCIGRDYQRKGYASEALSGVIKFTFEKTGLNRLQAFHRGRNISSGKVLQKSKMKYEGTLRQTMFYPEINEFDDKIYYGILKEEYETGSEIKLACFDLDHTLINGVHSVLFPCLINGKYREARLIDEKEEKGLMNWIDADFERAKLIQGLNVACLKENFDMILTPIRNIKRTISELQGKGIKCILITAGPVQVAKVAAEKWGFDGYYGSLYEEKNGTFTGKIIKHTGDEGKLSCLIEYCNKYSIMPEECVAIGDGSTDIPIFAYCGKSIAINYSDSMIGKAKYYLKTDDISDLLQYMRE